MSTPNWRFFRELDIDPVVNDADWAGTPATSTRATVQAHLIQVPLDMGHGRGACTQVSIYGQLFTAAGVVVNRGSMSFDVTPHEVCQPGDSGLVGVANAEATALIDGTLVNTIPQHKQTLNIGPVHSGLVAFRISNILAVPGTATLMRLFWRPGA